MARAGERGPPARERAPASPAPVVHLPVLSSASALDAAPPMTSDDLQDGFARPVTYLRVSLTDRCNYRCTYCMPEAGVDLVPRDEILSFEEIAEVVRALSQVGVRRVRLTGGEPTLRRDLCDLVARLSALGLEDLALSTNGERLVELAGPLLQAGLHRLNVSLDSLEPERFRQVTRRGHLHRVLDGLEAAQVAGFQHTKLNTVAMRGWNDDEIGALCRFAFDRGITPRFIEVMPMSDGALFYPGAFLPAAELRQRLRDEFGAVEPVGSASPAPGGGPARYVEVPYRGAARRVGLISAVTEPFCETCNRVRLSAGGRLHACLGHDGTADLRATLRAGLVGAELATRLLQQVRQAVASKVRGHEFTAVGCGGPKKHMVSIGG